MKNEKAIIKLFEKACQDWNLSGGVVDLIFKDFISELENEGYKIVKE